MIDSPTVAKCWLVCEVHTVNVPTSVCLTDNSATSGCHSIQPTAELTSFKAALSFLQMEKVRVKQLFYLVINVFLEQVSYEHILVAIR